MGKMNNSEAQIILKNYRICNDVPHNVAEALNNAITALGYRIDKPKHKYEGIRCVCGSIVASKQRFCEDCGQKLLDWKE